MNFNNQTTTTMEIDLHNLTIPEAKRTLERAVVSAPAYIREVVVIHGYNRGKEMLNMVRNQFKCRRVARKILTLNQGITILVLTEELVK